MKRDILNIYLEIMVRKNLKYMTMLSIKSMILI